MTQADAIVKALHALDTANDNHWTIDGSPRLDIVKTLASDQTITRDAVTLALPGFTRTKARERVESAAPPAPPPPPAPAQAPASTAQPQSAPAQGVATLEPVATAVAAPIPVAQMSRQEMISELQEELADAEADTADARKALEHMKTVFEDARKHEDSIKSRLEALGSKHDNTNAIQEYLASQRAQLEERGQRRRMVAEAGVNLRELSKAMSAAPIDQAMARRTGRGGSRPKFPKA